MTTMLAAPPAAAISFAQPRRLHLRLPVPVAGVIDDIEREDDRDGYEDAEDAAFGSIVQAALNDACGICGFWRCQCLSGAAVAVLVVLAPVDGDGQCSVCQGWFDDWNGGICPACRQNGS
ncbi:hypothetical protein ACIOC1_34145 [Streptomyces sp. NPDC088197]|uniref:hypothetical protein n=1 Tax=unclassified Streptomyces TaxID=2593676 RepID=UPI0036E0D391